MDILLTTYVLPGRSRLEHLLQPFVSVFPTTPTSHDFLPVEVVSVLDGDLEFATHGTPLQSSLHGVEGYKILFFLQISKYT